MDGALLLSFIHATKCINPLITHPPTHLPFPYIGRVFGPVRPVLRAHHHRGIEWGENRGEGPHAGGREPLGVPRAPAASGRSSFPFIYPFIHSVIHSSIHLFIHPFIHPTSIHPPIHPFIHPPTHHPPTHLFPLNRTQSSRNARCWWRT